MYIPHLFADVHPIRQFSDTPVPRELILAILDDAVWAPNHRLREPWRFLYVEGHAKKQLIAALTPVRYAQLRSTIHQASATIIVTSQTNKDEQVTRDDFAATCCLIQNIQLLGWAKGLGMHWDLSHYTDCPALPHFVDLGANERIAGIISIGYRHPYTERHTGMRTPPLRDEQLAVW